jgi:hypothetical protein
MPREAKAMEKIERLLGVCMVVMVVCKGGESPSAKARRPWGRGSAEERVTLRHGQGGVSIPVAFVFPDWLFLLVGGDSVRRAQLLIASMQFIL